ncbi:serine/threonine-protein kinase Nek8-like [Rhopalosiphum padi]|uniref:serine/threonine-protein kinase Nek8-like n=1 Tax=Rhopalosiphum padi TaxID=40932 RepID=UPI00298E661C|nr:serine/threonine-protein kinase Nek8-like [Rhopalosiphum padi]XP_060852069.1 serine/threonine-protein kinase Nek8-like [Rhopalosiphum padi]XP_060852070.1 serine/threonine-protein kinase Nek8-like [Rhopalosiphum padi]
MDSYNIVGVLGRGAFGVVELVRDFNLKKLAVMKTIHIESMSTENVKEAIKEIQILQMLNHPNIIRYYNSFQNKQSFHIIMEYAIHGTLENFVNKYSQNSNYIAQNCVLNIFSQLTMAVDYIHKMKIMHSDINPMNILLTGNQGTIVKLGDFGSSRILTSDKINGENWCTPCYMSPEQCCGKPLRLKSDIWQIGCVLYYLITSKHPFYAESLADTISSIVEGVLSLTEKITFYDNDVIRLLYELLNRDPTVRPNASAILSNPYILPYVLNSNGHWFKSGRKVSNKNY